MRFTALLAGAILLPSFTFAQDFAPKNPECVAPAAPGGGFDLTCRLTSQELNKLGIVAPSITTTNLPGGIGAVAYNQIQANRRADDNLIVAVSTGSWVNLAQGKFGRFTENDVRWIGTIGADFGVIAVRKDSRFQTLEDLMTALKADASSVVFGAGGTVGSQDWMKPALLSQSAGVDPKGLKYLSYEGGGEALAALLGGTIEVLPGDASEMLGQFEAGEIRILATLSEERLDGAYADTPTAAELGYNVAWPIVRGFYGPPEMSDEAYAYWSNALTELNANPEWATARAGQGLYEYSLIGEAFDAYAKERTVAFRALAESVGLPTTSQ